MSKIIAITCPSGKQCQHLIPILIANHSSAFKLRLAAHTESSATRLRSQYPYAEVVVTDLQSLESCQSLLSGVTSVYHVGPSFHSREKEMGFNMIDAAMHESLKPSSKFRHFVFSSVLNTQHRQLMQHDLKSYVEERLMISPLDWTILKPTNFMDAYPVQILASQEKPSIERLWTPETPNSLIALRDLAEAAAKVLVEGAEKHALAEYPLASTMPISDKTVIEMIGKAVGKDIEIKTPSFEAGVNKVVHYLFGKQAGGKSDLFAKASNQDATVGDLAFAAEGDLRGDICRDEAERLVLFYGRRGLKGSPNVLRWLLGRESTSVQEWIEIQLRGEDPIHKFAASVK